MCLGSELQEFIRNINQTFEYMTVLSRNNNRHDYAYTEAKISLAQELG